MQRLTDRVARATALLLVAPAAVAHPGHGIATAFHWHATDTVGMLLVGGLAGLIVWLSRGGRK